MKAIIVAIEDCYHKLNWNVSLLAFKSISRHNIKCFE
jgi:hypothetical protein